MDIAKRTNSSVVIRMSAGEMDKLSVANATDIMEAYKSTGVILEGDMGDRHLTATDEISRVSLDYNTISEESYTRNWFQFFGLAFVNFLLYLQAYIAHFFGRRVLGFMQSFLRDMKKLIDQAPGEVAAFARESGFSHPHEVGAILSCMPVTDGTEIGRDRLVQVIIESAAPHSNNRRDLPDFRSILTLNHIIQNCQDMLDDTEKLFYAPFIIYWDVSCLIPMRPREYLLTPRDCLRKNEKGQWMLSVRKDMLKGHDETVYYKIDQDYKTIELPVPESLAEEILNYQKLTELYPPNELGTLFAAEPHYAALKMPVHQKCRYFTYSNLVCVLNHFYTDVVYGKFGYDIFDGDAGSYDTIPPKSIVPVHLGDTRHIALINIIAEGVPISAAMDLAGHTNPSQVHHYAGNILRLLESSTKRIYADRDYRKAPRMFVPHISSIVYSPNAPCVEMDEGYCYSPRFVQQDEQKIDVFDCIQAIGPTGELGWCQTCPYFRFKDASSRTRNTDNYLIRLEDDWRAMLETVDHYRMDVLGMDETIMKALLKVQSSINIYENIIISEIGDKADGTP